jgi:nucleoside-diphosphate-sugar epimerase
MSGETAARARSWCARRDEKNRRMDSVRSWMDGPVLQAERELGYRPEVSIDEAIGRALEWFRAQGMVQLDGKLTKAI